MSNALMALAAGGSAPKTYVDDVFSTYLYTGNGATQTINNGIDLAGKGGLVWLKGRSIAYGNDLYDTSRGANNVLISNSTGAQANVTGSTGGVTGFASTGFSVGNRAETNESTRTYVSWTFRKAPKFFDIVTYTGNGVAGRQIPHELGIAPGMVIVKQTDSSGFWRVYHRSLSSANWRLLLHTIDAEISESAAWNGTHPTDSVFTVGLNNNTNGAAYVAYLFAHDPSADGIIQCGSFTTDASGNATVNLGWEPQFLLYKASSVGGYDWFLADSMRDFGANSVSILRPNLGSAELTGNNTVKVNSTGFVANIGLANTTYIYLAIRRPNKPPTSGTEVYNAIARTGTGAAATVTGVGFAPDLVTIQSRSNTRPSSWIDRLRGSSKYIVTAYTDAEVTDATGVVSIDMDGCSLGTLGNFNADSNTFINHFFRRAPGFMDEVCDTGTAAAHAISHNLTKAPELLIRKSRSAATQWEVWHSALAATEKLVLNSTAAKATDATAWDSTVPTASQFTVGTGANVNADAATFDTYLFATLTGISKIGSYTGNGTTQTINCWFTTGSRFILIKRTDSTGDWYVWDTVRGIVSANDPHLSLNTTATEVTTDDSVDPDVSGFIVNQVAETNINVSGGQYIFLSVA